MVNPATEDIFLSCLNLIKQVYQRASVPGTLLRRRSDLDAVITGARLLSHPLNSGSSPRRPAVSTRFKTGVMNHQIRIRRLNKRQSNVDVLVNRDLYTVLVDLILRRVVPSPLAKTVAFLRNSLEG